MFHFILHHPVRDIRACALSRRRSGADRIVRWAERSGEWARVGKNDRRVAQSAERVSRSGNGAVSGDRRIR